MCCTLEPYAEIELALFTCAGSFTEDVAENGSTCYQFAELNPQRLKAAETSIEQIMKQVIPS